MNEDKTAMIPYFVHEGEMARAEQLRDMMQDAPDEHIRMEIERLANKVEKM